jgi:hypothetical protein
MSRAQKYIVGIALAVAVLLAAAYAHFWVWTVVVVNESDELLSHIKIELAGNVLWEGRLAPGNSRRTYGLVDRDGAAVASYDVDGSKVEVKCGYVTGGPIAQSIRFTLNPEHDGCAFED